MQELTPKTRRMDGLTALCTLILFVFSYLVFYTLCLRPASDISIHATWAAEGNFSDLRSFFHHGAHPMWHVLVVLLLKLGLSLPAAAAGVTALCKALEFVLIRALYGAMLPGMKSWAVTLWALCCVMVSGLCLPCYNPTVYAGVGTPNTWHSCTQMISMVWMLLCVPYTARCYDQFEQLTKTRGDKALLPWRKPLLLCLLLLCSLAAKPTFMQVFLPAACLFFLYQWIRHPKNSRFFLQVLVCILPAVLLMILQYMYYFGIIVPSQGSMVLELSWGKVGSVLLATLLIQGFPLYVLLTGKKPGKDDTLLWLTLIFDIVGVLEFLFLGENGRRAADGNFGWGMMGAALMLWVVTLPRFAAECRKPLRLKHWVGLGLLGWHLVSGVYYLVYLLTNNVTL